MKKGEDGFLVLELLIAGLILTASVAATMYLFRVGAEGLERVNNSNLLASKLPQALSLIKELDLGIKEGKEDLGEGVSLSWKAELIEKSRPAIKGWQGDVPGMHELYFYKVYFDLDGRALKREYEINVFRYKALASPSEMLF